MSERSAKTYQLILEKVPEEKQPETALFLSGCFSLPPASTRGIAASGPIALLSELTRQQAESIFAELKPSFPEGVRISVEMQEERSRASRLQWPRPPKIYGSTLDEFITENENDIKCPICGGLLHATYEGSEIHLVPAVNERRRNTETVIPSPRPSDRDPLFSGVKPLALETSKYASIRSLQAGDTGFWMDHTHSIFAPASQSEPAPPARTPSGDTSTVRRSSSNRPSTGLAAFMKAGAFAVIIGRSRDAQIIKAVSEIMGVPESEARDRCLNLSLCIAREIALDEAQQLSHRLTNLGAKVRIVRPS